MSTIPTFKILNEADIRKAITMSKAIELMKEAFVQISSKTATVPIRTGLEEKDHRGRVLFMPAYSPGFHIFGLKMVTVFPDNTNNKLPSIQGKMLVMDDITGSPLGLIDAEYLTALRTGAASGLASDLLSNQNSKVLAIFGTGAQAHTQVEAILCVRPIDRILVYGTDPDKEKQFCLTITNRHSVQSEPGSSDTLKYADIICTATTSTQPVFELDQLKTGVHINGIGSYKPEIREIPSSVIKSSLLVVDHMESALSEAGDIILPIQEEIITEDHIYCELGEIVTGSKSGRTTPTELTVFKSVGNAVQDLAMAHHLLK